ncbi:sulfotransferase [Aliifodinibius sp. S!AR15-10]|uniref:sulfotransferase family protein n=1 Tax=Aliifodinibius sp. S!AR15-10 TaxID=2950437 RepID=UPI0028584E48|nr:sulfotransferase [Aliifodinibius sp. S!AR15-10]MDR8394065.1 sulfotransferase [Aliifodinibius sp. S!AR15-10]
MDKEKAPYLCMIGGTGRSGTTVLRRIFGQHPKVATLSEFYFTVVPGGLYDFYRTLTTQWTPYLFDDRLETLRRILHQTGHSVPFARHYRYALQKTGLSSKGIKLESPFAGVDISHHCPNYHGLVDQLIDDLTDFTYPGTWTGKALGSVNKISGGNPTDSFMKERLGSFYRSIASCIVENSGATHFVEDNTWNILYLKEITELLPDARLVHIYRDPRDVVASFIHQTWTPSDAVESARFYRNLMDRWQHIKQQVPEDIFMEISLEELVQYKEEILKETCAFWSLEWNDKLMGLELNRAHRGRWKKDIPADQQEEVLEILTPYLEMLGYE